MKPFKRILFAADLPDTRFLALRHTAATHMLAYGIDLVTVSSQLGHTQASTTLNTYAYAVPGTQEKAAAIMDEITNIVSLPAMLNAPQFPLVAPGLHREQTNENSPT